MSSTLAPAERQAIALRFVEIAIAAGAAILAVGATGRRLKADESPVTAADEAAEAVILDALASRFPDWPVVSEEAACANGAPRDVGATYILVDPLDGTREFLAGNGQYTVNVALVEGGRPTVGAIYAPAQGRLWFAGAGAHAARMRDGRALGARPIRARPVPSEGAIALASRSHLDPATGAFLEALAPAKRMQAGSSLKFCEIAEGRADVYPRFGPTMAWDVGAGQAILEAAGGAVLLPGGEGDFLPAGPDAGFLNGPFVAWGDRSAARKAASVKSP